MARDMERCLSYFTAYDFAKDPAEVWWGEDPTPEKYITIMDLSPIEQINKSKTKYRIKQWCPMRCSHFP